MRLSGGTLVGWLNSELFHEQAEVGPGEFPFEGGGDGLIVALEAQESVFDSLERGEVIGDQDFTLDDRKIDLDLVEPAGVDGVCTSTRLGKAVRSRCREGCPRCEEPLSTIQKTRRARW